MNLKKIGKYLRANLFGPGPSSYKKRIYRPAVSQSLRNTALGKRNRPHSHEVTRKLPLRFYIKRLT